jgi:hypothetical protein
LAEQGEISYLTQAENQMIAIHNETFKAVDPIEELIRSNYDFEIKGRLRKMSVTDIAIEIGHKSPPSKSQVSSVGRALTVMNVERSGTPSRMRYHMPHKIDFQTHDRVEDNFSDLI